MATTCNLSRATRVVAWLDEKVSWRTFTFMKWYCHHYYLSRCSEVGENFQLLWPVRKPIIRGGGRVRIGKNVTILGQIELMADTGRWKECEIRIGDNTMIGDGSMLSAKKLVSIGSNCLLGRYVYIYDHNGHPVEAEERRFRREPDSQISEIHVGDNVWIGHFAHVQSGVTIGNNSIIAPHSVVTKPVPSDTIVMGAPARVCGWTNGGSPRHDVPAKDRPKT